MEFGRLNQTNYTTPDVVWDKRNLRDCQLKKIHFGLAQWGIPGLKGTIYPEDAESRSYLNHYCKRFSTVEFNGSFYHMPSSTQLSKWASDVKEHQGNEFLFCPKILKKISHQQNPTNSLANLDAFVKNFGLLGDHLGPIFFQFPDWWGKEKFGNLQKLIENLPKDKEFAIELRHLQWFHHHYLIEEIYKLYRQYDVYPVILDLPGIPQLLNLSFPTKKILVRFLSSDISSIDRLRIKRWLRMLKALTKSSPIKEVFFFIHRPDNNFVFEIVEIFLEELLMEEELSPLLTNSQELKNLMNLSKSEEKQEKLF